MYRNATMIRPVTSADLPAMAALYNHYILNTTISFEEQPVSAEELGSRVAKVHSAGLPWLVAEENGELVGYAYAGPWHARSAYRYTVEISVYLSYLHCGRGWGTRLYESLFVILRKLPVHTVIGGIALPNVASIALHEKFGMQQVAHYRETGYKFGQWIDVGYWQVMLDYNDPASPS